MTNPCEQPDPFGQPDPFAPQPGPLPTLPALPDGFDWRVQLEEHIDSTNLTDTGWDGSDYNYAGWFWENGRPIYGHKHATVFLRQNGVILKSRRFLIEGYNTEYEFVCKVVEEAERLFNQHDEDRRGWLATDFAGLQEQ